MPAPHHQPEAVVCTVIWWPYLLLSDADYIARVGVVFVIPSIHPGPPPIAAGTTAAAISVALRAYTDALDDVVLYNNLRAALTAQILNAVNPSFLSALKDPDVGLARSLHLPCCWNIFATNHDTGGIGTESRSPL